MLTEFGRDPDVLKGLAAGVVAGLAASWMMNQYHALASQLIKGDEQVSEESPATVKAAEAVSGAVLGHELSEEEQQSAGNAIHYAFGATIGALYGGVAEVDLRATAGAGTLFGTVVWLAADEVAVPASGLSKSPLEYPAATHLNALAAHLVYGVSAEIVRRVIRDLW